jgi:predicted ATPase
VGHRRNKGRNQVILEFDENESTTYKNPQEEEIKGIQIGKEVVKQSLLADDTTLHRKDLKNSNKPPRCHEQLQQIRRIQNQFTKISSLFLNHQ